MPKYLILIINKTISHIKLFNIILLNWIIFNNFIFSIDLIIWVKINNLTITNIYINNIITIS